MRQLFIACALCAVLSAAACNPAATTDNTTVTASNASTAPQPPAQTTGVPPISSAHGGGATQPAVSSTTEQPEGVDTKALDEKIEKLEGKVKASGASAADKKALANAYLDRANIYRDAGSPRLYKFALGDYRRVLRYDPTNAEAKNKMDEIISIYNSMGRPVPTNGLEDK
jgi:hypothetical protein